MQKDQTISTLIEEGSSFEGRLSYSGTAKIAGQFRGEIFTRDQLVVCETASVSADVEASHVILKGNFEGNIIAHSKVVMIPPANFKGTVTTPSLKIEEGVIFEGASYVPRT